MYWQMPPQPGTLGPWPYPQGPYPQAPPLAPPGADPLTIHGMEIQALKKQADKQGTDLEAAVKRIKALEEVKDTVRRYGLIVVTSLISILGHFNKDPVVQKIVGVLDVLAKALKG